MRPGSADCVVQTQVNKSLTALKSGMRMKRREQLESLMLNIHFTDPCQTVAELKFLFYNVEPRGQVTRMQTQLCTTQNFYLPVSTGIWRIWDHMLFSLKEVNTFIENAHIGSCYRSEEDVSNTLLPMNAALTAILYFVGFVRKLPEQKQLWVLWENVDVTTKLDWLSPCSVCQGSLRKWLNPSWISESDLWPWVN